MGKTKIIVDSGSDISLERAEKLGIRVLPISYTFDGETYYRENIDQTLEDFYHELKFGGNIPKTTQITPAQFEDVFNEEYDKGYDDLIVVTISSKGSGMYQNACMMAKEIMEERGGRITCIDSEGFTHPAGIPVVLGAKKLKEGASSDEVIALIRDIIPTLHAYFIVGDLTHLKKGGRINTATLAIANMLDIKPVLTIEDGLVVQKDKIRGSKRLYKKLVDKAVDNGFDVSNKSAVVVTTLMSLDKKAELEEEIKSRFENCTLYEGVIGPIVACHAGPDLVGVVYSDKYDITDFGV